MSDSAKYRAEHPGYSGQCAYRKRQRWKAGGVKAVKSVEVLYQGCADRDQMSLAEYQRWNRARKFPAGTQVWIHGKKVA